MKKALFLLALMCVLAGVATWRADAQYGAPGPIFTCAVASVSSTSVPVSIIPPGSYHWFQITVETNATHFLHVFPYTGVVPGSPPSGYMQVVSGATFPTNGGQLQNESLINAGQGWAMVGDSATTVTADTCYR